MGDAPKHRAPEAIAVAISPAPSRGALLEYLAPRMTEIDLAEIAAADHFEFDQHLRALRELQRSMRVVRLDWAPHEAVSLQRWSDPDSTDGHRQRLFACAVLFDAYFIPAERAYQNSLSDLLAPLVASAICVGPDVAREARRSVTAMLAMNFPYWEEDLLFAGMSAVLLSAAAPRSEEDHVVAELVDWVFAERDRMKLEGLWRETGPGILGGTMFNQYHPLWKSLAGQHLLGPSLAYSETTNAKLRSLGSEMLQWT